MVIEPEGATQVELTTVIVGGTGVVLSFSSTLSVLEVLVRTVILLNKVAAAF